MPQPVTRTQADGHAADDFYGELAATQFDDPSLTRQEFAKEADPNYIIARHGINPFASAQPFGEVDFTMDLQQAIASIENAKRWHAQLPDNLKGQFPNWESVLRAANDGTLVDILEEISRPPGEPPKPTTGVPPVPPQ